MLSSLIANGSAIASIPTYVPSITPGIAANNNPLILDGAETIALLNLSAGMIIPYRVSLHRYWSMKELNRVQSPCLPHMCLESLDSID